MERNANAWIYLRKSRALGDPDDPELLLHHRAALERLAAREGITVPSHRVIQEIGSAETIAARPHFAALVSSWEELPRGSGGVVLVTELERLSRGSLAERGRIVDALQRADIRVLTLSRWYDLADPDDATWFTIFSELGKRELEKFKGRLALKLADLLRNGRTRNGREPFGYEWDPRLKNWRPHPHRFPILQAWCEEISSLSVRRIGEKWGVPSWVVHDTLCNPAICGWPAKRTAKHNGDKAWACDCAPLPRDKWLWPERAGDYEPACSRERWEQIQTILAARREPRARVYTADDGWCRDLVRFTAAPDSRVHLSCDSNQDAGHRDRPTYATRPPAGPRLYIARRVVHEAAEDALRRVFASHALVVAALSAYRAQQAAAAPPPDHGRTLRALTDQRDRARRHLVDLLRRELDEESAIQQHAIAALRAETEVEIRQLEAQIQAAAVVVPAEPELDALLPLLSQHLADLDSWWHRADHTTRRRIAGAFLAPIEVVTEPVAGQRAWRREVAPVRLCPWLEDHVLLLDSASATRELAVMAARLRDLCRAA